MRMTLRRLRRDESGFSLIELLMAMALGSIVLTACMMVFLKGSESAVKIGDRTDSLARGRVTMNRVITLLNSQTCLVAADGTGQAPIVDGQSDQITFYASLGKVDSDPTIYRLRYVSTSKQVWEDRYLPSRDAANVLSYPATPSTSQVIGTNVVPYPATTPVFQYWQFVTDEGPTLGMIDSPALTVPLTADGRNAAVRVTVSLASVPERTGTADLRKTAMEGVALVGSANPGEPAKGVNC